MINMLLYKGQRVSANGAMAGELGTIYEGYKVAQAANALVDVAVTYLALEAGVRFYNTNEAKYWIEQLQGAVKYIVCQDIEGVEYYIDKAGNIYDNSLKLIPATARPEGVIVTGVKIDKDYIKNNIVSINEKVKTAAGETGIIKKNKTFNVVEGQVFRCLYEFNADYIGYPDRTDGRYTKELGKVTVNCGEKYNIYINKQHTGICDKDNHTDSFVFDTTDTTGTKEITISQYLYYNPYFSVYEGRDILVNSISFMSGDVSIGNLTTSYYADEPIIAAFDFSIYESNGGSVSGNLSGDGIEDGSIDININETGCMDIDVYNNSPVANRDSISLNPDLVNDVVENNKSIDDVLSSLDYSKGNVIDQIIDKTAMGESEENKSVDEENNTGRIKLDTREERIKHIFRKSKGHFEEDTPENRSRLEDLANDSNIEMKQDKRKNYWKWKTEEDGRQLWVKIRNNKIINAGINEKDNIRQYNEETGLDEQFKKNQKGLKSFSIDGGKVVDCSNYKLSMKDIYKCIELYLEEYNKNINFDEDITSIVNKVKMDMKNINEKNESLTEGQAYEFFVNYLDKYLNESNKELEELEILLGDLDLLSDGEPADPAAWEDWISIVKQVVNQESSQSNSGDTTSIPATTGIIGAIGSLISRRKKRGK